MVVHPANGSRGQIVTVIVMQSLIFSRALQVLPFLLKGVQKGYFSFEIRHAVTSTAEVGRNFDSHLKEMTTLQAHEMTLGLSMTRP